MEKANELRAHWTNQSVEDFVYRIGFDFIAQLEAYLASDGMDRSKFADAMGVSKGRASQILNNPGNLRLGTIVQCARALGRKVSIVAYDDGDPFNNNGPVSSGIFEKCWNYQGRPISMDETSWSHFSSTAADDSWQDVTADTQAWISSLHSDAEFELIADSRSW